MTPKEQAATKWWNKLHPGERTRLIRVYGIGLENCVKAHENEQQQYAKDREELLGLLGGDK